MSYALTLVPAYGRDYKSAKAVKADFKAGKDFIVRDMSCRWDGRPANLQDLQGTYNEVHIRYNRLTKIAVVKL